MRLQLYILTLLILIFGCENKKTIDKTNKVDTLIVDKKDSTSTEVYIDNIYKSDSLKIDIKNDNFNYSIIAIIGSQKREYDLTKMNIPTKTPELFWVNQDYACIVTWWSQAQSRHIYIPTKQTNEFIYLDKDIEEMDSINNNIVYIDTVTENPIQVVYKVENLLTRKNKSVTFRIDHYNGNYPFYDNITLTKNKLTINTAYEKKSIDLQKINNGL
jgi:hypothetical protein